MMSRAVAARPGRDPAIPAQVARVMQQAEIFRKQLEELQARLSPVMGHDVPVMANEVKNGLKGQVTCPLADQLERVVDLIEGGNATLANIFKRLEV